MRWGVWLDHPTYTHHGKWATDKGEVCTFACYEEAVVAAVEFMRERKYVSPPWNIVIARKYVPTTKGEYASVVDNHARGW